MCLLQIYVILNCHLIKISLDQALGDLVNDLIRSSQHSSFKLSRVDFDFPLDKKIINNNLIKKSLRVIFTTTYDHSLANSISLLFNCTPSRVSSSTVFGSLGFSFLNVVDVFKAICLLQLPLLQFKILSLQSCYLAFKFADILIIALNKVVHLGSQQKQLLVNDSVLLLSDLDLELIEVFLYKRC